MALSPPPETPSRFSRATPALASLTPSLAPTPACSACSTIPTMSPSQPDRVWAVKESVTRRVLLLSAILLIFTPAQMTRAEEKALSILQENCQACHNPQKHKGGLVLTTRELLL